MRTGLTLVQILFLGLLAVAHGKVSSTCSSSGKCPSGQCCLKNGSSKTCAPRGNVGSECYVANDAQLNRYSSSVFNNACPCKDGYTCQGSSASSARGVCIDGSNRMYAIPGK